MLRTFARWFLLAAGLVLVQSAMSPAAVAQVFFPAAPVMVQPTPVFVQPTPVVWGAPRRVTTFYSPAPVVSGPVFVNSAPAFPVVQAAPVTTFYSPSVVRQTTFFAPAPVFVQPTPVVVQPAPVFVSPGVVNSRTVYRRGWPVRSTTRWGW